MRNQVAQIIKVLACINGGASVILAMIMYGNTEMGFSGITCLVIIVSGVISSILIYGFAEIISLLQGITDRLGKRSHDLELPPL